MAQGEAEDEEELLEHGGMDPLLFHSLAAPESFWDRGGGKNE